MRALVKSKEALNLIVEKVFLFFSYFVGIGATSILAKLFGKNFLNLIIKNTSWEKPSGSRNLKKMY